MIPGAVGWSTSRRLAPTGRAKAALLGVVIVVGMLVPLLAASSQVGASTAALRAQEITPGVASKFVARFSAAENRANRVLSLDDQNEDEQGSAAQIDDSVFTIDRDAGLPSRTGSTFYPVTIEPVVSAVPHQDHYPAQFAVVVKYRDAKGTPTAEQTCAGTEVLQIFEKDSASAPWRLALEPDITPGVVTKFASSPGGFATPVRQGKLELPLSVVQGNIMAALNTYAASGTYINGFSEADFNSGNKCWAIDDLHADIARAKAANDTAVFSAKAFGPSDVTAYALPGGAALVAFTVPIAEVETSAIAGDSLTTSNTQGNPASYLAPVGTFSTLTYPELCQVAAIDPAKAHGGDTAPRVVGAYCGYLQGSGT
jgi:hypothetical protein